jgi:hypothetical protein
VLFLLFIGMSEPTAHTVAGLQLLTQPVLMESLRGADVYFLVERDA